MENTERREAYIASLESKIAELKSKLEEPKLATDERIQAEKLLKDIQSELDELNNKELRLAQSVNGYIAKNGCDSNINMKNQQRNNFSHAAGGFFREYITAFKQFFIKDKVEEVKADKPIDLKGKSPLFKKIVSIDRKVVYICVIFVASIALFAFFWGFANNSGRHASRSEKAKVEEAERISKSHAVSGDHLTNVPKDYTALAEEEKKQRDADKMQQETDSYKKGSYAARRNNNSVEPASSSRQYSSSNYVPARQPVPQAPDFPKNTASAGTRQMRDPAEEAYAKALEKQLELKARANESKISFDIKRK